MPFIKVEAFSQGQNSQGSNSLGSNALYTHMYIFSPLCLLYDYVGAV